MAESQVTPVCPVPPVLNAIPIDEVAAMLGVTRNTVKHYVKDGDLPAFHVSLAKKKPRVKDWRILAEDLKAWQERRRIERNPTEMVELPPYRPKRKGA